MHFSVRRVWLVLNVTISIAIPFVNANSVDPDQTQRSMASDLGLHYFTMSLLWDAMHKWVKQRGLIGWFSLKDRRKTVLTHLCLEDCTTRINWESPFIILGVSGLFLVLSWRLEKMIDLSKQWSGAALCGSWSVSTVFAYVPFMGH